MKEGKHFSGAAENGHFSPPDFSTTDKDLTQREVSREH